MAKKPPPNRYCFTKINPTDHWCKWKEIEKDVFKCTICGAIDYAYPEPYESMLKRRNANPDERKEHAYEYAKVQALQRQGHTPHCAYRMAFGDGQCTCKKGVMPDADDEVVP